MPHDVQVKSLVQPSLYVPEGHSSAVSAAASRYPGADTAATKKCSIMVVSTIGITAIWIRHLWSIRVQMLTGNSSAVSVAKTYHSGADTAKS